MTAGELCLKEGELAQSVWLPLALCELVQIGSIIARRAAGELGELKVPKKSDILRGWWLPFMADAMGEDEEEAEAFELLRSVQRLADRQKGKAE